MPKRNLEKLVTVIFRAERAIRGRVRDGAGIDPFTMIRLETLRFIAEERGPTMKDVAENLRVTAPTATSIVGSLVKAGLVTRKAGAKDRRVICLAVTGKGRRTLEEGFRLMNERMKKALSVLDGRDVRNLIGILTRFVESDAPFKK